MGYNTIAEKTPQKKILRKGFPNNISWEAMVNTMENMHKNSSIKCSVHECKYNMGTENYCSLDVISVGTHEPNPTVPECTDCNSFVKRSCC